MHQNWFELGDYCLFAEQMGCRVSVNTTNNPPQNAENNLRAEELRKILDAMESESAHIEPQLKLSRVVWLNEVERARILYRSAESKKGPEHSASACCYSISPCDTQRQLTRRPLPI